MEALQDESGRPLCNRDGKQLYRLLQSLSFYSAALGIVITVPVGFVTDLDSTPRIPFVYLLINGFGDLPAVVHDYLYSTGALTRAVSDAVLREACSVVGVPAWKIVLIYAAVRVGGGSHYGPSSYSS
jgi:hypothetical protein